MSPLGDDSSQEPVLSPDEAGRTAARLVFRFYLQRFAAHEPGARAGDVEGVHQLRVATRRLRAALRLFTPTLPATFVTVVRRDLSWLAATIGAVRDLDVLAQQVNAAATRLTGDSRRALGPVALAMHDQRQARHQELVAALDAPRCRRLLDRLGGVARSRAAGARLGLLAPELVRPLLRAMLRAGRDLTPESPPEKLHRLRVRAKRVRYALETLRSLGGKEVARTIDRLTALQDVLGASQDGFMAIEWLRAYAAEHESPPETLVATGGIIEVLARRSRKRTRRFADVWAKLDRRGFRGALLRELTGRRRPPAPVHPSVSALRETGS